MTTATSKKYLQLSDLDAYKIAFHLSNYVWDVVLKWDFFARDTVGKQYVRAVDSISANTAEGFGRYSKKDKVKFYRYSFGSLKESQDWTEKARRRGLLSDEQYHHIMGELEKLPRDLYGLINFTNDRLSD